MGGRESGILSIPLALMFFPWLGCQLGLGFEFLFKRPFHAACLLDLECPEVTSLLSPSYSSMSWDAVHVVRSGSGSFGNSGDSKNCPCRALSSDPRDEPKPQAVNKKVSPKPLNKLKVLCFLQKPEDLESTLTGQAVNRWVKWSA